MAKGKIIKFILLMLINNVLSEVKETKSGLKIEVTYKPEECEEFAKKGQMLKMHYTGRLNSFDGEVFDGSRKNNNPLEFSIGVGRVIKGWDEGIINMCVGEKRKLIIPPHLGYGEKGTGSGSIPPNATLYFEVELLGTKDGPPRRNVFILIDADEDRKITKKEMKDYLIRQVVEANEDIIGTKELEDKIRQQDKIMEGIFVSDDKDKDGLISHPEFSGPKEFLPNTRGIHYDL